MTTDIATIRDSLCNLRRVEIPRPKCMGMQFVATRGRMGFYQSIRKDGEKFGLHIKQNGPRRPSIPTNWATITQASMHKQATGGNHASSLFGQTLEEIEEPGDFEPLVASLPMAAKPLRVESPAREPSPDYNDQFSPRTARKGGDKIALPVRNPPPAPPLLASLIVRRRVKSSPVTTNSSPSRSPPILGCGRMSSEDEWDVVDTKF